ncbi:hypothetical protein LW135_03275 [Helicobacter sp. faydin-H20]|uniref:hypothetical protein n=1 Tax=Helicobacter anatolicus TaxID=2905874 RepID=UPI001E62EDDE|nr:hypothetical protein [Helicobacter anatolicus]MCE3036851.1 hypothetical protein [Helicobacter anatolicus]
MRFLTLVLLFCFKLFSCSGDCASCHYKIDYQNDTRHSAMLKCKTCHTPEKMAGINMGDTCGQDCFACHDAKKLQNQELKASHNMISSCINCHVNLSEDTLNKSIFLQEKVHQNFFSPRSSDLPK